MMWSEAKQWLETLGVVSSIGEETWKQMDEHTRILFMSDARQASQVMNREEAQELIGQSRQIVSQSNTCLTTRHECVKVTGIIELTKYGVRESYDKVWTTAYEPGDEMWMSMKSWLSLPIVLTDEEQRIHDEEMRYRMRG